MKGMKGSKPLPWEEILRRLEIGILQGFDLQRTWFCPLVFFRVEDLRSCATGMVDSFCLDIECNLLRVFFGLLLYCIPIARVIRFQVVQGHGVNFVSHSLSLAFNDVSRCRERPEKDLATLPEI